jgi:hypothetical protein
MNMRRLSMSGTLLPLPLDLLDANQRPAKSIGMSRELYRCIAGRFQSGNNYSCSRWGIIWMTFLQDSSNLHSFPKLLLRRERSERELIRFLDASRREIRSSATLKARLTVSLSGARSRRARAARG